MANTIAPLNFVACNPDGDCNRYEVGEITVDTTDSGAVQVGFSFFGIRTLSTAAESTLEIRNTANNDIRTVSASQYGFTDERRDFVTLQGSPGDEIVVTLTGSNAAEISGSPDRGATTVPSPFDPSGVESDCYVVDSVVSDDEVVEFGSTVTNATGSDAEIVAVGRIGDVEVENRGPVMSGETVEFVFEIPASELAVGVDHPVSVDVNAEAV